MNSIVITKLSQLQRIENSPILLTGQSVSINQETDSNMWAISFGNKLAPLITAELIKASIENIIKNRVSQVSQLKIPAVFYLWHDIQTNELRFNIISAIHAKLPFGCSIEKKESMDSILDDFISHIKDDCIPWNDLELIDENDESHEDIDIPYTLQVFCLSLHPQAQGQ